MTENILLGSLLTSKRLETVDSNILIKKLKLHGVAKDWFISYLKRGNNLLRFKIRLPHLKKS